MPPVCHSVRRFVLVAASIVVPALLLGVNPVHAQSFPDKPVRIIVPFPPGGDFSKI